MWLCDVTWCLHNRDEGKTSQPMPQEYGGGNVARHDTWEQNSEVSTPMPIATLDAPHEGIRVETNVVRVTWSVGDGPMKNVGVMTGT